MKGVRHMSLTTSPFPPIADYAFLSNCHTGAHLALIEAAGRIILADRFQELSL
jgi:hypothetical protein